VHALLLVILSSLFGSPGILVMQRSRSSPDANLSALLLGLASCLVAVVLLLMAPAHVLL
jgi:hypothetical protein